MKKIVALGLIVVGINAFGAIDAAFSNVVGVVRVMTTNHYALVSVPFGAVGMNLDRSEVTLSNLVQTVNLGAGDTVELYSEEGEVMFAWKLSQLGVWEPVDGMYYDLEGKPVAYKLDPADTQRIGRGWAMRLYRNRPTDADGKAKPVYLTGQYDALHGERTLRKGSWKTPKKSLVSFPGIRPFDLNTIREGVLGDDDPDATNGDGDEIDLITDGAPFVYRYRDGQWCWRKTTTAYAENKGKKVAVVSTEWVKGETIIPQGTGFWYKSRGGTPTIRW